MNNKFSFLYINFGIDKWNVNNVGNNKEYNQLVDEYMETGEIDGNILSVYTDTNEHSSTERAPRKRKDFWKPARNFHIYLPFQKMYFLM